jgi:hypothetical protein
MQCQIQMHLEDDSGHFWHMGDANFFHMKQDMCPISLIMLCVVSTLSHFVHPFMTYSSVHGFHSIMNHPV